MVSPRHPRATGLLSGVIVACVLGLIASGGLGGCSWFSDEEEPPPDPFAAGVLNTATDRAPADSEAKALASLAAELGWEDEIAQDQLIKDAIEEGQFDEKVVPRLLGLFFRNGFSVLPKLGEGHEFTRDTLVRGEVANSRYLVTTRDPIRIVFLGAAQNIVIIYPRDGVQPQVYSREPSSTVALRESRTERYLN